MRTDPKFKKYLDYLTLGGELAVSFCAPILLGFWIDSSFETSPWGLLGGIILGLVLMLGIFWRVIRNMNQSG